MPRRLLLIFLSLFGVCSFAQNGKESLLLDKVAKASTDSEKIAALNELAEYYYIFKLDNKADSVLRAELVIAEVSSNKDLVFQVLFSDVITNVGSWSSTESFDRTSAFLEKGLYQAKESGRQDYQAIAYMRMANLWEKRKEFDKAIEKATLAFSALGNNNNLDSLRSSLYLELGDIFLGKGDPVSAYRNYNNAYDLAYTIKNISLQSETFHRLSQLYQSMGYTELAKENLFKSLELNKSNNNEKGLVKDYINLARITEEKEYIVKAQQLAQSLKLDFYILFSKRLMHAYIMYIEKDSRKALAYLEDNKDFKQVTINQGLSNYYWTLGNIYKYCDKPDSALYYFNLAEPEFVREFDKGNLQLIYNDIAECYVKIERPDTAINFYERSYALSKELHNLKANASISASLSKLYAGVGEFKKAYNYSQANLSYRDSLRTLAAQRDVTLLEMQRETLKHQKDLEEIAQNQLNKRNLQYMSISISIAGIFFFLVMMGAFPVSKFTIKLLGYFSFICLFEFIVLLMDTYLHRLTNGEPLKTWLLKIFIIAMLVPFQHFLEHNTIKFLQSRKLLKLRNRMSIKKWWANLKKPARKRKAGIEEDTAVL
jgi:tetratricopeptide (TPR) repeat protein